MESDEHKKVKELPTYMDLFNGSDQIIDEKLQAYQTSMKRSTKDRKKLVGDCSKKMREAELQSERDSIVLIDAYKTVEKHKYRDIAKLRADHMEVDYETEKEFLVENLKNLKKELLGIEVKLTDGLNNAFKDFETRLKALISSMRERTSNFFEESSEEVMLFAFKLKTAVVEKALEITAYLEAVPDDKKETELDMKENELGTELFNFLVLEPMEDIQAAMDGLEEHLGSQF